MFMTNYNPLAKPLSIISSFGIVPACRSFQLGFHIIQVFKGPFSGFIRRVEMSDPITAIAHWLSGVLSGWGLSPLLVDLILNALGILVMVTLLMVLDIFLVWVERKVVARFQDRLGPNRLGPYGLIQPFADIIKLLIKEDITPKGADRTVYNLAPILSLATVLLLWAVIPLMPAVVGADLNVGVLYLVAVGAVSTLAIIMAGWASQNKYALLGAMPVESWHRVLATNLPPGRHVVTVVVLNKKNEKSSNTYVQIVEFEEGSPPKSKP